MELREDQLEDALGEEPDQSNYTSEFEATQQTDALAAMQEAASKSGYIEKVPKVESGTFQPHNAGVEALD